ncbi:sensor histidine kinase [Solihabitans fulvus]|uniref:sensor histidine kinase n=1 Tax=Solihabitans fulvus TaxID=1892852 RepID=UPI001CB767AA|nr:histidine kinase [Solihabitans fulvus]
MPAAMVLVLLIPYLPQHHGWLILLLSGLAFLSSVVLMWARVLPEWVVCGLLLVLSLSGATLYTLTPRNLTIMLVYVAVTHASRRNSQPTLVIVTGVSAVATVVSIKLHRGDWLDISTTIAVLAAILAFGIARRARLERLEQTELALAREQTAREEHARAAALAERARIARELHDVLAHSLAALSLNLQGTRLILVRDGASAEAVGQVERAQRLAADGLNEARRAVAALREDPVPVQRGIADLVTAFRLETSASAEFVAQGTPRELSGAASNALYRTAQEALTNTRKHAPGAPVEVLLDYQADRTELTVVDRPGHEPRAAAPGGYGLTGMRERAELIGGTLHSGPTEDGWRVHLVVPE